MKRVIKGKTNYEKKLLLTLKTEQKTCEYGNCHDKATELFYNHFCDVHFYFCIKHANIIEANKEKTGILTFDVKTGRKTINELER